jgi:hypothetical protein
MLPSGRNNNKIEGSAQNDSEEPRVALDRAYIPYTETQNVDLLKANDHTTKNQVRPRIPPCAFLMIGQSSGGTQHRKPLDFLELSDRRTCLPSNP